MALVRIALILEFADFFSKLSYQIVRKYFRKMNGGNNEKTIFVILCNRC